MTRKIADKKIALTFNEYVGLDARGDVVHFHFASIRRAGDVYVMEGKTGKHIVDRDQTDFDRLNAHWIGFVRQNMYV
jgi:hypothetical protein